MARKSERESTGTSSDFTAGYAWYHCASDLAATLLSSMIADKMKGGGRVCCKFLSCRAWIINTEYPSRHSLRVFAAASQKPFDWKQDAHRSFAHWTSSRCVPSKSERLWLCATPLEADSDIENERVSLNASDWPAARHTVTPVTM